MTAISPPVSDEVLVEHCGRETGIIIENIINIEACV